MVKFGLLKSKIEKLMLESYSNGTFKTEMKNFKNLSEVIKKASQVSDQEYLIFSKNARKFAVDNFSEKNHYSKLMTVYNKLINEK